MAYDLQEQEQLEAIKSWWEQYGTLIITVVVACLLTIAAFQGWRYYRNQQSIAAVTLYEQLSQAERANEHKKVRDIALQITDKYSRTPYAAMAALSAGRAAFETGDLGAAKAQLPPGSSGPALASHAATATARAATRSSFIEEKVTAGT